MFWENIFSLLVLFHTIFLSKSSEYYNRPKSRRMNWIDESLHGVYVGGKHVHLKVLVGRPFSLTFSEIFVFMKFPDLIFFRKLQLDKRTNSKLFKGHVSGENKFTKSTIALLKKKKPASTGLDGAGLYFEERGGGVLRNLNELFSDLRCGTGPGPKTRGFCRGLMANLKFLSAHATRCYFFPEPYLPGLHPGF